MTRLALVLLFCLGCRPSSDPSTPAPSLVFGPDPAWPDRGTYPGVGAGRLLITNSRDDTVSLFDVAKLGEPTFPELARVPVGLNPVEIEAPHHAAIAPDGKHYFIGLSKNAPGTGSGPHGAHGTGAVDGDVLKVRASDNRLVGQARVDRNPGDLTVSPDGKRIAVSHYDLLRISEAARGVAPDPDARIAILDADTLERIAMVRTCPAPHGLRFSADGKRLYVACYSDEIAVMQMDVDGFPSTRVKVAANAGDAFGARYQPYGVAISPLTQDVYVSCLLSGEVRVLNAATLTMDPGRTALVGGTALLADFSLDGSALYAPHQGDDRISVVDPGSGTVVRLLTPPAGTCVNVHQVLALEAGRLAIVCEGNHLAQGSLLVTDAAAAAVVSTTPLGVFPDFVGLVKP